MPESSRESSGPGQTGEKVRKELEKLLESAWSSSERALDALGLSGLAGKEPFPRLDVMECDASVEVVADIPGIDPELVNISLMGNMLTISGTHPLRETVGIAIVQRRERPTGDFSRSIPLPAPVDADSVTAVAKNGTLEITLKKPESEKPRQIQIQVKSREETPQPAGDPVE